MSTDRANPLGEVFPIEARAPSISLYSGTAFTPRGGAARPT
jgi:hypothetical protein